MPICEVCQSDYDKTFEITLFGRRHVFDSFECAIHAISPTCGRCGRKIPGRGVESGGRSYCGAGCATAGADGSPSG